MSTCCTGTDWFQRIFDSESYYFLFTPQCCRNSRHFCNYDLTSANTSESQIRFSKKWAEGFNYVWKTEGILPFQTLSREINLSENLALHFPHAYFKEHKRTLAPSFFDEVSSEQDCCQRKRQLQNTNSECMQKPIHNIRTWKVTNHC